MRIVLIILAYFSVAAAVADENSSVIAVIVPAQAVNQNLKITPNSLKLIYLRKQLYWPNGKRVMPVNLYSEHALRNSFSRAVLGSLPKQQIDYWNGLYFNGIQPPHIVNSEEAVLRLVSDTQGAIGYVSACAVDNRVRAVLWIHDNNISINSPLINCSQ